MVYKGTPRLQRGALCSGLGGGGGGGSLVNSSLVLGCEDFLGVV